jgi:hypothetical protein
MKTYCYCCGKTVEGETKCYCEFHREIRGLLVQTIYDISPQETSTPEQRGS